MAGSVPVGNDVGPSGFKVYLDRLLKDSGNPSDPIERMMIEQLALAHHRIAQLHVQAAEADTVDAAKQYMSVAIRLTGELRRMSLAIKQYRQPTTTKQFTVIKQQNVATGDQQVAYLDQSTGESDGNKVPLEHSANELTSKRLSNEPSHNLASQPKTSGSRSPAPQAARPANGRRP